MYKQMHQYRGEIYLRQQTASFWKIHDVENVMSVGGWEEVMRVLKQSETLLEDTLAGREQLVADALDRAQKIKKSNRVNVQKRF